jgi:hypothetical protein
MEQPNPEEYLKSHMDQVSATILLTSKIDLTLNAMQDQELDLKQKRLTSEIRNNLSLCLTFVKEMQSIHQSQLREQRVSARSAMEQFGNEELPNLKVLN